MATAVPCPPEIDALKVAREGTEQKQRFLAALDPKTVPVHGRALPESLLFARAYAEHLRYHATATGAEDGTWRDFFGKDVSVSLASAAVQDVARYRRVIQKCVAELEDLDNAVRPEVVRANLGWIFGMVGTLAQQIDLLKEQLPPDIALRATLVNLIESRLRAPLQRLIAHANADARLPAADRLLEPSLGEPGHHEDYDVSILGVGPHAFGGLLSGELSPDWRIGGALSWSEYVSPTALNGTPPDDGVFGSGSVFERANRCAGHNLFTGACDQFLKAYARIAGEAGTELARTLESWNEHAPHYALFLVFLRMFEHARAEMNTLGGRHLDFYYRKVLGLAQRPAEASRAHVVVELAKGSATHELPAGTEFKAGKDATKAAVTFRSVAPLVANRAAVAALKSLYRDSETDSIHVNPAAKAESGAWHPFRSANEIGSFGFAIASHYLRLAEGTRRVKLNLAVTGYTGGTDESSAPTGVVCRFTTAKGWLEKVPTCCFKDASTLEITVQLTGQDPEVTAFDAKQHGAAYEVALPILEVRLGTVDGMRTTFQALESVCVQSIALEVEVSGFRSLTLSTDLGPVDGAKPFQPFGPAPTIGSSLVIGCQEAFSKKGATSASLALTWRKTGGKPVSADVEVLSAGQWTPPANATPINLTEAKGIVELPDWSSAFNPQDDPFLVHVAPYGLKASTGYVRLRLESATGFGIDGYAALVAEYVAKLLAKPPPESNPPPALLTPELEALTLDYVANQVIDVGTSDEPSFRARGARFYHLTPFGLAEQHAWLRRNSEERSVPLLPTLRHVNALDSERQLGTTVAHEGELFVGLSGVVAPQNVALLFQVEDGTADPLTEKPDPHLHFSYLRNGDWVAFERDEVEDHTSELLESGVLVLAVPADASVNDTLLPGGLTWIRIAAGERTRAVCKLLAVTAQALQVVFEDRRNDRFFLAAPLPAGTIQKLVTPAAAVKSVTQPFESFGGRMAEEPEAFRARVSERLRHKDRAVALWDIEHLVLESFPGVHRVRCLNHTRYEPTDTGQGIYDELAAGHVTVVTIPAVSKAPASDPFQPHTSMAVLRRIRTHLERRMSCFAELHVTNPAYERVRVKFKVRLGAGCDEAHSVVQLKTAIARFLAPWAFDLEPRPSFGGKVHRSTLIHFVENQPCVDYVTDFELFHEVGGNAGTESQVVVEGTRTVSVLTSVPPEKHVIEVIDETEAAAAGERCGCSG